MGSPTPSSHEPRRAVAVMATLLPHLAHDRHHIYRNVTALALLAALLAAALGSLPISLVLAGVALPAVVLTYIHDHKLWRDEPITVIAVTFLLSLALGVGVGLLQKYFTPGVSLAGHYRLPSVSRLLEVGVVIPVVAFLAVLIIPLLVTGRDAFRHPLDVVVTSALSGAALSLGYSVVIQHNAFTHHLATAGDPTRVAFISLTLGFLQPVILATAAAVAVLGVRGTGVNAAVGIGEGLVLLVLYGVATTLLVPYGARGIVLIALVAFVLAGSGLLATRAALHTAADAAPDVDHVEHRLNGAVVAAIIAVVVIVAAGVTAALVFSSPSTQPKPPSTRVVPTKHAQSFGFPGIEQRTGKPLGHVVLESTQRLLATTLSFADGVPLVLAPGWTVIDSGPTSFALANPAGTAQMNPVTSGGANTSDITDEAAYMINQDVSSSGYTNVVQAPNPVAPVVGNNFTQSQVVNYTALLQTNQGTVEIFGNWVELFNPGTKTAAFIDYFAVSPADLQASSADANAMINSML
jgi:hypothetical protein